ncbi:MAG: hypothetical protein IPI69_02360 [Bacteroidales bacterium]|nr:hypothetical protein [Bacteroidales bacterium]
MLETSLRQNNEIKEKKSAEIAGLDQDSRIAGEKCSSAIARLPEEFRLMEPKAIVDLLRIRTEDMESFITESAAVEKSATLSTGLLLSENL